MEKTILELIEQICQERKIPKEKVLETLEYALAAAYRKDFGLKNQNLKVNFDPATGKIKVFDIKIVAEDQEKALPKEEAAEEIKEETEEKVIVITKRKNITEIQDQGLSQKIA